MIRNVVRALALACVFVCAAVAPGAAQNVICSTAPLGSSDNRCASTAFVAQNTASGLGTAGYALIGNGLSTAATFQGFLQAGTGALTRIWQDKNRDILSAKDFLTCDGVTDEYTAMGNLAARAKAIGADITVPALCKILINMSGSRASINLDSVHIYGAGPQMYLPAVSSDNRGSWFLIKGISNSPFTLNYNAGISGMSWVWPDQVDPAAPIVYPAAISATANSGSPVNVTIERNLFVNAYVAIELQNGGFNWIADNRFAVLNEAIRSAASHAESWITRNSFSYGWGDAFYTALGKSTEWHTRSQQAAIAMHLDGDATTGDTSWDAWNFTSNTVFGYAYGILGVKTPGGGNAFLWGVVSNNNFDLVYRAIFMTGTFRPAHLVVASNTFNNQSSTALGYHIGLALTGSTVGEKLEYEIVLTGNDLSITTGSQILISTPAAQGGRIVATGNNFFFPGYLQVPGAYYSAYIDAPGADFLFSGNSFDGFDNTKSFGIGIIAARSLTADGNVFKRLVKAVDQTGTISENLVLLGNSAMSDVTVPVTTGTVSGTTRFSPNSWNVTQVVDGGTGNSSLTSNAFLTGNGTSAVNQVAITGLVKGNGASAPAAYAGTSCTNQFPRSLDANGAATCASIAGADLNGVFSANGILTRTAASTYTSRTITGTAAEITATNGDGVSGNPTLSLPSALTFTGKTITGGTYASPTFSGTVAGAGTIPLTILATQATNTVVGNATAGSASPTALTMTSCSTASSAVTWTTNTGFSCNTSITASSIAVGGITGLGTGVATALAVNVGSAGAFVTFNGALGTPSSGTLTSATGLPISTGVSGLGTSVATALAVNVGTAGSVVVNGGALGTPSSATLTNATGLPLPGLAAQAANTVVGNGTSGSASPTALAMTSCSTAASAVTWTTNSGFGCNTSITANAVPAANLTGSTLAAGVTASSLTSVGTLTQLTIQASTTTLATLSSTASSYKQMLLKSLPATGAAGDGTDIAYNFTNSAGTEKQLAIMRVSQDTATASSEDASLEYYLVRAGAAIARQIAIGSGMQIGSPTGAYKGVGTLNIATGLYANNSAGLSTTKTVRASGGAGDCTLIYTMGILTGGSC